MNMSAITKQKVNNAEAEAGEVGRVRLQLVEVAGRFTQELGLGRLFGQLLGYLYLHEAPCSLDDICQDLSISKASASIAARQLERLGLVVRAWVQGDRKTFYRSADNIATALQQGLAGFLFQKVSAMDRELGIAISALEQKDQHPEAQFLTRRLTRAGELCKQLVGLLTLSASMDPAGINPALFTQPETK